MRSLSLSLSLYLLLNKYLFVLVLPLIEDIPELIKTDVLVPVYVSLLDHLNQFIISKNQTDSKILIEFLMFDVEI